VKVQNNYHITENYQQHLFLVTQLKKFKI